MDISKFIDILEKRQKGCVRKINVEIVNGKKKPSGEHKDWSIEQIIKDRGNWSSVGDKTFSISVKHIPNLYVIDFDTKDIKGSKLYEILKNTKCYYTETNKGWHYYCIINNLDIYKNQINIGTEGLEMDLLKDNNCWETNNRKVNGQKFTEFDWDKINKFFNESKMNFNNKLVTVEDTNDGSLEVDESDIEITEVLKCDGEMLKNMLSKLKPTRFEYTYWLEVGIVCYNNFDGDMAGLTIWDEWSKKDSSYSGMQSLLQKWSSFTDQRDRKLSYKRIQSWLITDNSANVYEIAYYDNGGFDAITLEMNKVCIFYKGNIILLNNNSYDQLKESNVRSHFKKYSFKIAVEKQKININPFNIWLENFNRKDVDQIVFNPKDDSPPNHFNTWKGFMFENTGEYDIDEVQPVLDLIRDVWADGDEEFYNYVLNWFSHILQIPWEKNGVCIALQSMQGVGKTLLVSLIGKIIGDSYYYTASSLKHILGDFNGDAEGKLLVNMNECTWGGDKKQEGAFKEFITDESIVINRKGLNTYRVNNLANTIITTNADWVVAVSRDDRRYNIRRCKNITLQEKKDKYTKEYYNKIANVKLQHLANFLFNRDISQYNPRIYTKSKLHREQTEKGMGSVEYFYTSMLSLDVYSAWREEDFNKNDFHSKNELYELYLESVKMCGYSKPEYKKDFFKKIFDVSNQAILYPTEKKHSDYYKLVCHETAKVYYETGI